MTLVEQTLGTHCCCTKGSQGKKIGRHSVHEQLLYRVIVELSVNPHRSIYLVEYPLEVTCELHLERQVDLGQKKVIKG